MDLGYHWDLLEMIFRRRSYSLDALRVAQFSNGLTDLVGNFLSTFHLSEFVDQLDDGDFKTWLKDLLNSQRLHADNLFAAEDAQSYFNQLMQNLLAELKELEDNFEQQTSEVQLNRCKCLIVLIGVTSHALQDFCSHSTWINQLPAATRQAENRVTRYRRETPLRRGGVDLSKTVTGWYEYLTAWPGWKSVKDSLKEDTRFHDSLGPNMIGEIKAAVPEVEITELAHRDLGINLDAQQRRYEDEFTDDTTKRFCSWDEAYLCAYLICEDLMSVVEQHAPQVASRLKSTDKNAFHLDQNSQKALFTAMNWMRYVFMWLQDFSHHDGHWKGPGSGDISALIGNLGIFVFLFSTINFPIFAVAFLMSIKEKMFDELEEFWDIFKEILATDRLAQDLYKLGINNLTAIDLPDEAVMQGKVFSLRVDSVTMKSSLNLPPHAMYNRQRSAPLGPDLFIRATIQSKKNGVLAASSITYDERARQNVPGEVSGNLTDVTYSLSESPHFGPPWEVLHIADADVDELIVTLQLFDEDTLATGSDDEIKISNKDTADYGVKFSLSLVDQKVKAIQGLKWPDGTMIHQADDPTKTNPQPISGATSRIFFKPETANMNISMVVANIEPPV